MPPPYSHIKVVREEDFRSRIGEDGHYFDLIDFSAIEGFNVPPTMTILRFKEKLTEKFGTPLQCQRLWWWARRQNNTYRVDRPLTTEEENLPVLNTNSLPTWSNMDDALVFLKHYDPGKAQLRYVGLLSVKVASRPSEILPKLRSLAGFCLSEMIELYEIITGDIICFQKILKPPDIPKYPSVASFLQHVCDRKTYEEVRKVHILEEEIVTLKHQADTYLVQKEKAVTAYDQLKHERDNAVQQVNELRDQSTHIILDFSRKDMEQATEHFKNAREVGDTEYGHTYKGMIHNMKVLIKLSSSQKLFQQEVSILRQWRHPNIITFIGVCSEVSALVYEWLPNGNLEDRIICTNNSAPLSWYNRTQIIGEICCALLFLHSNKSTALVHGDLRPCNILIDANYRSKICNFGMSNLFLQLGTFPPNLTARLPYMDPEFNTTGELTTLSDVYSLGVIILRLLTGMPPLTLSEKVAEALGSDSLHLLIDKSAGDWPYIEAKQLALIGLSCTGMTRKKRPDLLNEVWIVIEPLTRKPPAATWPYLQSASGDSSVPAAFICPISMEIMKDPQVASDGFTYEAEAIRCWFDRGISRSPMTNLALPNLNLVPNRVLRSFIHGYLQQQQPNPAYQQQLSET
ncbi:U-box domain-containing protein 57 isoform X1 [Oryza sativa Japonica Group]|uniref:U-box domain-containing protein 57 isoform X1 n=1 Tax=Oryza sativa subsp. japonica TaxID=39947 RepID=UPI00339D2BBA